MKKYDITGCDEVVTHCDHCVICDYHRHSKEN